VLSTGLRAEDVKPGPNTLPPKVDAPPVVPAKDDVKVTKEKLSYCIGFIEGNRVKSIADQIDLKIVMQAMQDVADNKPAMKEEEIRAVMTKWQADMMAKQQEEVAKQQAEMAKKREEMAKDADKNKKAGEDFLAGNKGKEGVVTTASGLQYKEMRAGNGASPKASDTVVVHYKGTLLDGTEFDSSYKRNEPATFGVDEVIKGWTEALQLMKTGSKFMLWIPSGLAYGDQATGDKIGPNSTLTFEVELLEIKAKK
jgi:FKBP-type peptidyl-prolyl cis-trans isomerase